MVGIMASAAFANLDGVDIISDVELSIFQNMPQRKKIVKDIIKYHTQLFKERDLSLDKEAILRIEYWLGLCQPLKNVELIVTAFGGCNMKTSIDDSSHADTHVRMGHLRMTHPDLFPPCANPYSEYHDNEHIMLPVVKTTDGAMYAVNLAILALVQDIISGYMWLVNEGGKTKNDFFPMRLYIKNDSIEPASLSDFTQLHQLLKVGKSTVHHNVLPWPGLQTTDPRYLAPLVVRRCETCKAKSALLKKCECKKVYYCNKLCQKNHWSHHKLSCCSRETST
jgi:hypothetical protein